MLAIIVQKRKLPLHISAAKSMFDFTRISETFVKSKALF